MSYKDIAEVKRANKALGHYWFDPKSVQYHGSRVETPIIGGHYWVESSWLNASDRFDFDHSANLSPDDYELGRGYRVVSVSPSGSVQYLYGAEHFASKQAAIDYINGIVESR